MTNVNLKGAKKGDATSIAIITLDGGITDNSGSANNEYNSDENGARQRKHTKTAKTIFSIFSRNSTRWDTKGCSISFIFVVLLNIYLPRRLPENSDFPNKYIKFSSPEIYSRIGNF